MVPWQIACAANEEADADRRWIGEPNHILTSERRTMNGSTEKWKPPIVLHGVGLQAERQRADAEQVEGIAAMRPWPHIGE